VPVLRYLYQWGRPIDHLKNLGKFGRNLGLAHLAPWSCNLTFQYRLGCWRRQHLYRVHMELYMTGAMLQLLPLSLLTGHPGSWT
jgi:hypothetical protein